VLSDAEHEYISVTQICSDDPWRESIYQIFFIYLFFRSDWQCLSCEWLNAPSCEIYHCFCFGLNFKCCVKEVLKAAFVSPTVSETQHLWGRIKSNPVSLCKSDFRCEISAVLYVTSKLNLTPPLCRKPKHLVLHNCLYLFFFNQRHCWNGHL